MRGPPNICTETDRRRWAALIGAGLELADAPCAKGRIDAFGRAHARALSAVFPDLTPAAVQPFRALLGFAEAWRALDEADRRVNAEALRRCALECAAIAGQTPTPPEPPPAAPATAARLPYRDDSLEEDAA